MKAENFGEYYLALDNALHIKKINDRYTEITGYDMEDVMEGNHTLAQLTGEEEYQRLRDQIIQVLGNGETKLVRHRIRAKDQSFRDVMSVISLHREGQKLSALHCFLLSTDCDGQDVALPEKADPNGTQAENVDERLEQSTRDNLTGLLSQSMMSLMVNQFLRSEQEDRAHAFLLLDIDKLKEINHRMGYFFGDTVIENLADILREVFTGDTLIGRVEGDKFAVLVQDTNAKEVIGLAEQACWKIRESYVGEDERLRIRVRIGISVYPFNGTDYKKLYHDASMALYQLKIERKTDTWLFYEDEGLIGAEQNSDRTDREEQGKKVLAGSETGASGTERGTASDRVVELRRVGLFDTDLVMFAFDVLSSGKDITSSVKMLMERVGKQYDLDRIAVLSGRDRSWPMQLSCWWEAQQTEKFLPKLPNSYEWEDWENLLEQGESYGLHTVESMATARTPAAKKVLQELQVRSMVACGAYRMKSLCGCVLFWITRRRATGTIWRKRRFNSLAR